MSWPRPTTAYDLRSLTTNQLLRLYHRAWERMTDGDGYQAFGYDAPTLWMTHPGWMCVLHCIRLEVCRRLHA